MPMVRQRTGGPPLTVDFFLELEKKVQSTYFIAGGFFLRLNWSSRLVLKESKATAFFVSNTFIQRPVAFYFEQINTKYIVWFLLIQRTIQDT